MGRHGLSIRQNSTKPALCTVHPAAPKFNRGHESKSAFVCTVLDIPETVSLNMGRFLYRVDNDNGFGLFST